MKNQFSKTPIFKRQNKSILLILIVDIKVDDSNRIGYSEISNTSKNSTSQQRGKSKSQNGENSPVAIKLKQIQDLEKRIRNSHITVVKTPLERNRKQFEKYFHSDIFNYNDVDVEKQIFSKGRDDFRSSVISQNSQQKKDGLDTSVQEFGVDLNNSKMKIPGSELWQRCRQLDEKLQINLEVNEMLRTQNVKLEKDTMEMKDIIIKLNSQLANIRERELGLQLAVQKFKKDSDDHNIQLQTKESQIKQLKAQLTEKSKEMGNVSLTRQLEEKIKNQDFELRQLRSKLDAKDREIVSQKAELLQKNQELDNQQIAIQDLQQRIEQIQEQNNLLRSDEHLQQRMGQHIQYLINQYKFKDRKISIRQLQINEEDKESSSSDDDENKSDSSENDSEPSIKQNQGKFSTLGTIIEERSRLSVRRQSTKKAKFLDELLQQLECVIMESIQDKKDSNASRIRLSIQDKQNDLLRIQVRCKELEEENILLKIELSLSKPMMAPDLQTYNTKQLYSTQQVLWGQIRIAQEIASRGGQQSVSTIQSQLDVIDDVQSKLQEEFYRIYLLDQLSAQEAISQVQREVQLLSVMLPGDDQITDQNEIMILQQQLDEQNKFKLDVRELFSQFCKCLERIPEVNDNIYVHKVKGQLQSMLLGSSEL